MGIAGRQFSKNSQRRIKISDNLAGYRHKTGLTRQLSESGKIRSAHRSSPSATDSTCHANTTWIF
jgi:hypothetical protein